MYERKLILDTCALIWLANGSKKMSSLARKNIDHAELVYVSAISAWEISLKVAQQTLELPLAPQPWFERILEKHNLILSHLKVDILISANSLPWHHRDPADRFIIATAMEEKATVVTADKKFHKYDIKILS